MYDVTPPHMIAQTVSNTSTPLPTTISHSLQKHTIEVRWSECFPSISSARWTYEKLGKRKGQSGVSWGWRRIVSRRIRASDSTRYLRVYLGIYSHSPSCMTIFRQVRLRISNSLSLLHVRISRKKILGPSLRASFGVTYKCDSNAYNCWRPATLRSTSRK